MKISYRWTSAATLGYLAMLIASAFLPLSPPRVGSAPVMCGLVDDQFESTHKLTALVWLVAFVVFTVQGLRNRSGLRWLGVAGVLALLSSIQRDWWRVSAGCYRKDHVAILLLGAGILSLMFLHHVVQRRSERLVGPRSVSSGGSRTGARINAAKRGVVPVLVFMPIAWSALNALATLRHDPKLTVTIITIQGYISQATLWLFVLAASLLVFGFLVRLRPSTKT